ncbi:MAG: hypothetical protein KatS3mg120_1551 [Erythrobacter sp.]|nr:MAG: hypothetical protein KatS3mg120_1551 [Erythrobacter sp.]
MSAITLAALQLALGAADEAENIAAVAALVEEAAARGAQLILPPELFSGPYFCREEDEALFARARPVAEHPSVIAMQALAARLKVAIPTSFFERDGHHYYNSLAMIGPNGEIMGTYRKSHIPDGPGYEEKYYFRPGNSGFKVWDVPGAEGARVRVGVGICWDQWYPECARVMALMGAEVLMYPTAIGSEPYDSGARHQPHVAPGDDRPCGVELHAARRGQPHRRREGAASASMAIPSSAMNGAIWWRNMARTKAGC